MSAASVNLPRRFRATALVVHKGDLLCVKMKDYVSEMEYWLPPGGKIETNESPSDTAIRETLEETGHVVKILNDLGVHEAEFTFEGQEMLSITHYFHCEWTGKQTTPSHAENYILEYNWIKIPLAVSEISKASKRIASIVDGLLRKILTDEASS